MLTGPDGDEAQPSGESLVSGAGLVILSSLEECGEALLYILVNGVVCSSW